MIIFLIREQELNVFKEVLQTSAADLRVAKISGTSVCVCVCLHTCVCVSTLNCIETLL